MHTSHSILKASAELCGLCDCVLNIPMKKRVKLKQQQLSRNKLQTAPQGPRNMTTSTTLYNWACFMTVIFIDSIHAIKPPIFKFPLTLQSALLLCFSSFEFVLRYSALFIKYAEPNELLTGASLSISSLKVCFIISRLLAFFGCRVAIYSSGSVSVPPSHAFTQSTFTLSDV